MKTLEEVEAWIATLGLPKMRENAAADMQPLIDMLPENASIAEIGVFTGECSAVFVASSKIRHLLCVDFWESGYEEEGIDPASDCDMDKVMLAFLDRMDAVSKTAGQLKTKYYVCNEASVEASKTVFRYSFDLVYIDADHRYESVKADIIAWNPTVKRGGILAGHDYGNPNHPGVKQAVDELLGIPNLLPDSSWWVRI